MDYTGTKDNRITAYFMHFGMHTMVMLQATLKNTAMAYLQCELFHRQKNNFASATLLGKDAERRQPLPPSQCT